MAIQQVGGQPVYVINVEGKSRGKDYSGLVSSERMRLWQENLAFEQQRMESEEASWEAKERARQAQLEQLDKQIMRLKEMRLKPGFSLSDLRQTVSGPSTGATAGTGPAVTTEYRGAREDIDPITGMPEIRGEQTVTKVKGQQLQNEAGELLYRTPQGELTTTPTDMPAMDAAAPPSTNTTRGSWSGVGRADKERFFKQQADRDKELEAQIEELMARRTGVAAPSERPVQDLQERARRSYVAKYGTGGLYGAPNVGLGARLAESELLDEDVGPSPEALARRGQRAVAAGNRERARAQRQYDRAVGAYYRAMDYDEPGAERMQDAARERMVRKGLKLPLSPESTIDYSDVLGPVEPATSPNTVSLGGAPAPERFVEEGTGWEYEKLDDGSYATYKDGERRADAKPGTTAFESIERVIGGGEPIQFKQHQQSTDEDFMGPPNLYVWDKASGQRMAVETGREIEWLYRTEHQKQPAAQAALEMFGEPTPGDLSPATAPTTAPTTAPATEPVTAPATEPEPVPDDMDMSGEVPELDVKSLEEAVYGTEGKTRFDKLEDARDKYAADTMKAGKALASKPQKLARLSKRNLPERQRRKEAPQYVKVVDDLRNVYGGRDDGFKKAYDKISSLYAANPKERSKAHEYLVALHFLDGERSEPTA